VVKNKWPNGIVNIYSSDSIYCSHLAIHFSPLAQVTQFTVPFGHSFFTTCSNASIYCSHLVIHFSLFAQVTYWVNWATGEKRMSKWNRILSQLSIEQSGKKECPNENSKLSHLSKWWKRNGQMGTVNWVTWSISVNSKDIKYIHCTCSFNF
jgi:hypothetical protein